MLRDREHLDDVILDELLEELGAAAPVFDLGASWRVAVLLVVAPYLAAELVGVGGHDRELLATSPDSSQSI